MYNECFDFWNYYFYCLFYGNMGNLFQIDKTNIIKNIINQILLSIIICFDFSSNIKIIENQYFNIFNDILNLNHRNLLIIYMYILNGINSQNMTDQVFLYFQQLINKYKELDKSNYHLGKYSLVNIKEIENNIKILLKAYKTEKIEYITNIINKRKNI